MKIIKNTDNPIQKYRFFSQVLFSLICIWIGIEYYFFAVYLETGGINGSGYRPPGAEAFLPISSLMNAYYFFLTGNIHWAHPAGLVIFLAILAVSFVFGKSFCSWICPVGFLSELTGDAGDKFYKKLFKKTPKIPNFPDFILRSLKYLLLAFFIYAIFVLMDALAIRLFLDSPYNITADIKMYYFFADISRFSLIVISILFFLSVFIRNFWCRYLCPYGALLGILSLLSPLKIKRAKESCIDCSLCAKACPSRIKVDKVNYVVSDECTACLSCVDACPVKDTLYLESIPLKKKFPKTFVFFTIILIYSIIILTGILSGTWDNGIDGKTYIKLYENIDSYSHPVSTEELKKKQD